jgi:uncharacterized membrane protein YdbT with pleckstrin-like domain
MNAPEAPPDDAALLAITRPHRNLLVQYSIRSLAGLIFAPIVWVPLYFKYHTLRYSIRDDGISASWGILFKREVHLSYKRIQDIHVSRSIVERYLGLGTVELQTAAGSASAELALEGMEHFEALREFLYRRMRGHEGGGAAKAAQVAEARGDEVVELLRSIRADLDATRAALESRR